jgi:hypothetical protein
MCSLWKSDWEWTVKGRNLEIIQICEQEKGDFFKQPFIFHFISSKWYRRLASHKFLGWENIIERFHRQHGFSSINLCTFGKRDYFVSSQFGFAVIEYLHLFLSFLISFHFILKYFFSFWFDSICFDLIWFDFIWCFSFSIFKSFYKTLLHFASEFLILSILKFHFFSTCKYSFWNFNLIFMSSHFISFQFKIFHFILILTFNLNI